MPERLQWRGLVGALVLSDWFWLATSFWAAVWVASHPPIGAATNGDVQGILLLLPPVLALAFLMQGLYDRDNLLGGTREYAGVFRACTFSAIAIIVLAFGLHLTISRELIVIFWALSTALVGSARFLVRRWACRLRDRGFFTTRAIIVGADADSVAVARQLNAPGSGIRVVGFLDDFMHPGSVVAGDLKVLGTPASLVRQAALTRASEAIVVPQALPWETLQTLLSQAEAAAHGLRLHLSAGFYGLLTTGVRLSEQHHVPMLTVNGIRRIGFESAVKRALDITLAVAMLVGFSPMLFLWVAQLRWRRGGPWLERRRIVGRRGRRFDQLSLRLAAPVGSSVVRKLPGLLNVLRGDLSLVGPRPLGEGEINSTMIPSNYLTVRPGLTGPWRQVDDAKEQALLDLYYIRSYSIWLDLQVLFRRLRIHLLPSRRQIGTGVVTDRLGHKSA